MSDFMVFDLTAAPEDKVAFEAWFDRQVNWSESHDYEDPAVATPALQAWFHEMRKALPAMRGPFASKENGLTDYCIGENLIAVVLHGSDTPADYEMARAVANRLGVGFLISSEDETDPPRTVASDL